MNLHWPILLCKHISCEHSFLTVFFILFNFLQNNHELNFRNNLKSTIKHNLMNHFKQTNIF